MSELLIGYAATLTLALGFLLITPEDINMEAMQEAQQMCEGNEGLAYVEIDIHPFYTRGVKWSEVYCNNGAEFVNVKLGYGNE